MHAPNFNPIQVHDISSGGSTGCRNAKEEAVQLTHWRIPTKLERHLYTILCYTNTLIQLGRIELELQKQQQCIHVHVANVAMSCSPMQFAQQAYKCKL